MDLNEKDGFVTIPRCNTWNTRGTEGLCRYESEKIGQYCSYLHECTYCKSRKLQPVDHQLIFCQERLVARSDWNVGRGRYVYPHPQRPPQDTEVKTENSIMMILLFAKMLLKLPNQSLVNQLWSNRCCVQLQAMFITRCCMCTWVSVVLECVLQLALQYQSLTKNKTSQSLCPTCVCKHLMFRTFCIVFPFFFLFQVFT